MDNRTAAAFNALSNTLAERDWFVPLSVRQQATEAALAAADRASAATAPDTAPDSPTLRPDDDSDNLASTGQQPPAGPGPLNDPNRPGGTTFADAASRIMANASLFLNVGDLVPGAAAAVRRAADVELYHQRVAERGVGRRRADELLAQAQGLHAGSTPTEAELDEAHRLAAIEAMNGARFRCTGTATLVTDDGSILLDVNLYEGYEDSGPIDADTHFPAYRRRYWGGSAATATAARRRPLGDMLQLLLADGPLTLRLVDGSEGQVRVSDVTTDPTTGIARCTLHGIGPAPKPESDAPPAYRANDPLRGRTMPTDALLDFLRQRFAEDEQAALAATPGQWWHNPGKQWLGPKAFESYDLAKGEEFIGYGGPHPYTGCVAATGPADDRQSMADADHIARHNPARVLAEVAAKRCIIAEHPWRREPDWSSGRQCRQCATEHPCTTLRLLALPYAAHADYRAEWAPNT